MKIFIIQQDINGKWFGYCEETKEYTPSFLARRNLKKMLAWKGWKWSD